MAIDFDGAASKLENTTYSITTSGILSLVFWSLADGVGEASEGRIITLPEGGSSFLRHRNATANTLEFLADFTGGGSADGSFRFTANDNVWNKIGLSYNATSTTNVPVVVVNGVTVTVTVVATPVGTSPTFSGGYCVGNTTGATRTWDGAIQYMQGFNVALTVGEMIQACNRPGAVSRGRTLFLRMQDATDVKDYSGNAGHATATTLGTRNSAPSAPLWPGRAGWQGQKAAGAATAAGTVFASRVIQSARRSSQGRVLSAA